MALAGGLVVGAGSGVVGDVEEVQGRGAAGGLAVRWRPGLPGLPGLLGLLRLRGLLGLQGLLGLLGLLELLGQLRLLGLLGLLGRLWPLRLGLWFLPAKLLAKMLEPRRLVMAAATVQLRQVHDMARWRSRRPDVAHTGAASGQR